MTEREFVPNSKYQIKMMLVITLIAFLILLGSGILAFLISLDEPGAGLAVMIIAIVCDASLFPQFTLPGDG
jgi:hypothetical protein